VNDAASSYAAKRLSARTLFRSENEKANVRPPRSRMTTTTPALCRFGEPQGDGQCDRAGILAAGYGREICTVNFNGPRSRLPFASDANASRILCAITMRLVLAIQVAAQLQRAMTLRAVDENGNR